MKNVKIPTSDSWLESLKDPEEAGLEEKDPEPEFLRAVIQDVVEARVQINNLSEEAKHSYEKLDKILLETKAVEIYNLVEFLDTLGFRIALVPKD